MRKTFLRGVKLRLSPQVLEKERRVRQHAIEAHIQPIFPSSRYAYEELYKDLPMWERTARTVAYSFDQQVVDIENDDVVIGRYDFKMITSESGPNEHPPKTNVDLSYLFDLPLEAMHKEAAQKYPAMRTDYVECGLHADAFWNGHEAHAFQMVLRLGWQGMMDLAERNLSRTKNEKSKEFYQGLIITLDALIRYNNRYVEELERRGMKTQAEICRRVPRYPARNFREAVQSINMVYFTVTQEASGTYGPGWLDYYLWPYLEKDLRAGTITEQEAYDLCAYLMIQMDSRILLDEGFNDTICLGGSHPNGISAINPLTYLFANAIVELQITCLLVYIKMPENPPENFVKFAAEWLIRCKNRGQICNDRAIAGSLEYRGTPYQEALSYTTNGCMEISCSNANSDLLLCGWFNMPKFVELAITGGKDLVNHIAYTSFNFKGLLNCASWDEFYVNFLEESRRILLEYFDCIDILSKYSAIYRPTYYASAMLNDCMLRGRNMSDGGTRYNDYGVAPVGIATAADYLYGIKNAVFDNGICTSAELIKALENNFTGYTVLQQKLKSIPKFGQDDDKADDFAASYVNDICDIYESYENRLGGTVKPVVFTFVWANKAGEHLGAMADGSPAHTAVSQGTTPAASSMKNGVTAAILSNCRLPMYRFSGGGTSMWDFDPKWLTPGLMNQFLSAFLELGGQMYQGNSSSSPEELKKAQKDPGNYTHLLVRVGGFSAHFVDLTRDVQDDIISRCRHNA
jgi:formate C-acetyltransferase